MDTLQKFNQELQSIQPPISKQKMMNITKLAVKNIKLYKHIVLSVEKYISRCPNSAKLSSLYVIDAIVRQSIHRCKDKDVYAARFARNFNQTFQYIFQSVPTHDKPKIVRVLNLWQRNGVFSAETIQPLLDLPNKNDLTPIEPQSISADSPQTPLNQNPDESNMMLIQQLANTIALVKGANKHNDNQRLNYDHHSRNNNDSNNNNSQGLGSSGQRLMDYNFGDNGPDNGDETPTEAEPPLSTTLNKIEMEQRKNEFSKTDTRHESSASRDTLSMPAILERWQKLQAQHLIVSDQSQNREGIADEKASDGKDVRPTRGHESIERPRTNRSRSRSKSPTRHKNRYSGRDDDSKNRSNSPTNRRSRRSRSRSPSKTDKGRTDEKNRISIDDRRKRGLPDIRKNCLTICSTTLWLGHVPKTVSEADISDAFGEFGTITSIDLIPPRGCAYVCMDRRQDAYKALNDLKNLKLSGSLIKMAWAPGKGLKDKEFKDYWEVYVGASFIPYNKLRPDLDIDLLEEGGVIDEDTMTDQLKKMKAQRERDREEQIRLASDQLASMLPVPIASMTAPGLPLFPVPPNLTVPPPSLSCINLPSLPRPIINGENSNEKGDQDNRITEQPLFTESSLSPALDKVSIPLPPMSIPPPPIFSHAPPPFGLPPPPIPVQSSMPPPPIPVQSSMPPLPIFQNPPPSIGQVPRLPASNQLNYIDGTDNEDAEDQRSDRSLQQQQLDYDEQDDRHNQNDESYQTNPAEDQQHANRNEHQQPLMHHHLGFQTNPAMMNSQDESFNYQMMPNNRPILQNMIMHPHQQQNFCEYDQHGLPSQGGLLPVPEENNLAHEYISNQVNPMYDFNCNSVLSGNGSRPGYTNIQFNFDEYGYNPNNTNEMNRWNGPPRPPGFVPRNVSRSRFRNGRGRERQAR